MMIDSFYSGSVESRIAAGQSLYQLLADQLRKDVHFMHEFAKLIGHAEDVNHHMGSMRLAPLCIQCSAKPTGGCCSLFMAGETDALQMLMNLFADIEVIPVRDDGNECIFLGENGCIFLFKPMFCLNYNCYHIHEKSTSAEIAELERLTGVVLCKHYELEQYLLGIIRRKNDGEV